jgi:hypothetical protein
MCPVCILRVNAAIFFPKMAVFPAALTHGTHRMPFSRQRGQGNGRQEAIKPSFPLIASFDPRSTAAEAKNLIINYFYFADFKILFTFAKE